MGDVEILVWERPAVDRPDSRAVAVDDVAALDREAGHDAVERRALVAAPTLAGAQLAEVLRGPVSQLRKGLWRTVGRCRRRVLASASLVPMQRTNLDAPGVVGILAADDVEPHLGPDDTLGCIQALVQVGREEVLVQTLFDFVEHGGE